MSEHDCIHAGFVATVEISRLFNGEALDDASTTAPDSLAIDITAKCARCGKAVRFEGPIGIAVGPGAPPMVSLDGLELRAAGHLGENRTPTIRATMRGFG